MQAILTRYHGPTNSRGSRITAKCAAGQVTIGYPHELSGAATHRKAAEALIAKLGWTDEFYSKIVGGQLPSGEYVWVFVNGAD